MSGNRILDKINENHNLIYSDPEAAGLSLANELQDLAIKAIHKGITSQAWSDYMSRFVTNAAQLERLKGNDPVFMALPWGPKTLAYLVANSTCGINTFTGTKNNMTPQMYNSLDEDFSGDTNPA
ncbi:MAG TPA: hypothetical protein VGC76_01810 [Pyrinomonadaceae bacterium]|jgi:hypothetical protein